MRPLPAPLLAPLSLSLVLAACASSPGLTTTGPATVAARDAYRACASARMAAYRSTDTARDKARTAVDACRGHEAPLRAALLAENKGQGGAEGLASSYLEGLRSGLVNVLADEAMRRP